MFRSIEIAPRAALAAPTETYVITSQSAAILVASILSLLGGGWMVVSFFVGSLKLWNALLSTNIDHVVN